ncbi:Lysine-specific histone demethylase 1 1 [Phytophthora citrophthora]|uniref:Lysine-specific histone demethylase 1 1 n=1 Tax=Phytophthora citrophthora TaxID=4793 RepID=A0AAD9GV27_9STRA|nr:Lysine-specific histone demethylase 1 1 [Phytophthora citrophthora]
MVARGLRVQRRKRRSALRRRPRTTPSLLYEKFFNVPQSNCGGTWLHSQSIPVDMTYRVVVIGAGMAGVATAKALLDSDLFKTEDVCVLEAQPRLGGRIHTRLFSDDLPVKVEAGAAWIHGTEGNPMVEFARKFGIELKEISTRNPWLHPRSCPGFLIYNGSRRLSEEEVDETWKWQELLLQKLQKLALSGEVEGKALDVTVKQLLTEDEELLEIIASSNNARERLALGLHLVETWMGSESGEMQIDAFGEIDLMGDDPGSHCLVPTGMMTFIDHLSEPLKGLVRTNTCVASINYEDIDHVVIKCTDGRQITADQVVVTCSLGFLKSGKLRFQPKLPRSKTEAISRSQMGQCMKVLVRFPEVFWPENGSFITQIVDSTGSDQQRIYFPVIFSYLSTKGVPILEGDLIGKKAEEISRTFSDKEIAHALFLQLQETFGPDIPQPVGLFITRWDQDEWARGAYSSVTVDSTYEDPDLLRQSVADRVFFAGEATDYEYQGALQAAYLSGKKKQRLHAAKLLLK